MLRDAVHPSEPSQDDRAASVGDLAKRQATANARLALRGFSVAPHVADDGGFFVVVRPGWPTRVCDSLADLEAFADNAERLFRAAEGCAR